jgi:hypothetical protein
MQFSGEQPVSPAFSPGYTVTTHGDRFFYGFSDRYETASYDVHGKLRELVRRSATRIAVTANDRAAYSESVLAQADDAIWRARFAAVLKEMPYADSLPVFRPIRIDREGLLWVQQYVVDGVASAAWSVFDKGGRWVTDVDLPTAWEIQEIGRDYILVVEKNQLDVEWVRLYELRRAGG